MKHSIIFAAVVFSVALFLTVGCNNRDFGKKSHITVPDDYTTIEEAYEHVKDNGIITIQPGKYELANSLVVNRNVTFRGSTGLAEDVVIDCPSDNAFLIRGGSPSFQNLTASSGSETYGGFAVTHGTPKIFRCIITSRKGAGIYVYGERANPQVESSKIKDCGEGGVRVYENGLGTFSDCEIYGNGLSGIIVLSSGNPTFTKCKIHDGKEGGVFVCEKGLGTFSDCDIYGNTYSGIAVRESGNPTVSKCKIHDGKASGVFVYDKGMGTFSDCEIYGNTLAGIEVKDSGNPTVTKCKIYDGKAGGVLVYEKGLGTFSDCDIYGNTYSGIEIRASDNPTVTGCKIHDGKCYGVYVHDKGMGTFNNNILENNYWNGRLNNWVIESDAGEVRGSGNTPPMP